MNALQVAALRRVLVVRLRLENADTEADFIQAVADLVLARRMAGMRPLW